MRLASLFGAFCVGALSIAPVAAQMNSPGMMQGNTAMAVMPDGHMGSMQVPDEATATKMMGMAKPATDCMMMMSDKAGKMSVVDTSSAEAKAECEKVAATPPPAANTSTAEPGMMQGGMVMAMMPNGHMGAMPADEATATKISSMAKPLADCAMIVSDKEGKVSMVDTSTPEAKAECEKVANMKPAM